MKPRTGNLPPAPPLTPLQKKIADTMNIILILGDENVEETGRDLEVRILF